MSQDIWDSTQRGEDRKKEACAKDIKEAKKRNYQTVFEMDK